MSKPISALEAIKLSKKFFDPFTAKFKESEKMNEIFTKIEEAAKEGYLEMQYALGRLNEGVYYYGAFKYVEEILLPLGYAVGHLDDERYYMIVIAWDHQTIDWKE